MTTYEQRTFRDPGSPATEQYTWSHGTLARKRRFLPTNSVGLNAAGRHRVPRPTAVVRVAVSHAVSDPFHRARPTRIPWSGGERARAACRYTSPAATATRSWRAFGTCVVVAVHCRRRRDTIHTCTENNTLILCTFDLRTQCCVAARVSVRRTTYHRLTGSQERT